MLIWGQNTVTLRCLEDIHKVALTGQERWQSMILSKLCRQSLQVSSHASVLAGATDQNGGSLGVHLSGGCWKSACAGCSRPGRQGCLLLHQHTRRRHHHPRPVSGSTFIALWTGQPVRLGLPSCPEVWACMIWLILSLLLLPRW